MSEYDKLCDFQNLYRAYRKTRRGKGEKAEAISFELKLGENLARISRSLSERTYRPADYYSFTVKDPKEREIHALHFEDRVVQHCLCDEILAKDIEPKLIYDNAACRIGKGTHFAMGRLSRFMCEHYRRYGCDGYILKTDIRKYFDSIDHEVLKEKLFKVVRDEDVRKLLYLIIDSYEKESGKGLPLGNQTSQWFALYYLDPIDRLVKERFRIRGYVRYMDDSVLVGNDKNELKEVLFAMRTLARKELKLEFNEKTEIVPMKQGVDFLGFHFYLTETGRVVKKLRTQAKKRYKRKLKELSYEFAEGIKDFDSVRDSLTSLNAHIAHGDTWRMKESAMKDFVLIHYLSE